MKTREELQKTQSDLVAHKMDPHQIQKIKQLTEQLISYNEIEERILMQRAKVDWLRKGDGNNSLFFATIKTKQNHRSMKMLQQSDGTIVHS